MAVDSDDIDVTLGLARATVAAASPGELEVFDLLADGYRDDPRSSRRGDGALGFDADVVTAAVVAVPVAHGVLTLLQEAAKDLLETGGSEAAKVLVQRWLQRGTAGTGDAAASAAAVPADVLARARTAAVEQATLMGLAPERAELLGNAVAGVLAAPA